MATIPGSEPASNVESERIARWEEQERAASSASRDIADVPAVEIVSAAAIHLMSAAAVKCGLSEDDVPDTSPLRDSGGTGPGPDDLDELL